MNPVIGWVLKQLFWMAVGQFAKHWGFDKTRAHFESILENAKPLPPDPLPSPKASREPKAPWLHTGDSIADASE